VELVLLEVNAPLKGNLVIDLAELLLQLTHGLALVPDGGL
jgi:hypothetical protein